MVKLFSKNSNLCDHNPPTSQTDRQTTCDRNTALCTKVHRAVKTRPGYESRNRCSFSRFLKVRRDGVEVTSTGGSLIHVGAPTTRKARRPTVGSLTAGTSRSSDEEDRSGVVYRFRRPTRHSLTMKPR